MKMKRLLAIFAIIAVLCTFCTVTAMADVELIAVEVEAGDGTIEVHEVDPTNEVPGSRVEPTCTEDGKVSLYCTNPECAAEHLWHTVTLNKLGHEWSTVVNSWGDATNVPTCQLGGEAVEVCERCGAEGEHRELDKIPHDFSEVVVDVDNCKEFKWHYECAYGCGTAETEIVNGKEQIKYHTDPAQPYTEGSMAGELKHDWTDWSVEVEPTCCEEGTMTRACVICGAKQARPIEKLDHTYEIVDQHLDSCEQISITWKCSDPDCNCQDNEFVEIVRGNFHKFVPAQGAHDTATCTADGELEVVCKYCGAQDVIRTKALGHDWSEWVLEKTFTKDGEEVGFYTRTCERCHATEELISATAPETPGASEEPEAPAGDPVIENVYALSTSGVDKGETTVSGTGTLLLVEGNQEVKGLLARIAVVYENEAGEQILVVNVAEIRDDMTFKIPSVKAPFGYTVKTVCVVGVNNDAAVDGAYGEYAICDNVVL